MQVLMNSPDELMVLSLYQKLLRSWNNNNAEEFASIFAMEGNVIGFDGSQMNGREEINKQIRGIFQNHKVSSYISIVREIRPLSPDIFLLRAVSGMVPPGKKDIIPEVNAIQSVIAQRHKDDFLISLFQNTPAAFHERPELSQQLTDELRQVLSKEGIQLT